MNSKSIREGEREREKDKGAFSNDTHLVLFVQLAEKVPPCSHTPPFPFFNALGLIFSLYCHNLQNIACTKI